MKKIILVVILAIIGITSCGEKKTKAIEEASQISEKPFVISNTWMRPGSMNRNTAAFMKIKNNMNVDDTLYSASSDLAKVVEIHETYKKENDMIGMRHVEFIVIPSKSKVELKPGSFHIMLIGLNKDLGIGDSGKITLKFKNNGTVEFTINVEIK